MKPKHCLPVVAVLLLSGCATKSISDTLDKANYIASTTKEWTEKIDNKLTAVSEKIDETVSNVDKDGDGKITTTEVALWVLAIMGGGGVGLKGLHLAGRKVAGPHRETADER